MGNVLCNDRECCFSINKKSPIVNDDNKICPACRSNIVTNQSNKFCSNCFYLEEPYEYSFHLDDSVFK